MPSTTFNLHHNFFFSNLLTLPSAARNPFVGAQKQTTTTIVESTINWLDNPSLHWEIGATSVKSLNGHSNSKISTAPHLQKRKKINLLEPPVQRVKRKKEKKTNKKKTSTAMPAATSGGGNSSKAITPGNQLYPASCFLFKPGLVRWPIVVCVERFWKTPGWDAGKADRWWVNRKVLKTWKEYASLIHDLCIVIFAGSFSFCIFFNPVVPS